MHTRIAYYYESLECSSVYVLSQIKESIKVSLKDILCFWHTTARND